VLPNVEYYTSLIIDEEHNLMQTFSQNIINSYGSRGKKWLAEIPEISVNVAKKYHLTRLKPVSNMTYNYVAAGYQHEQPIILKLGFNVKALAKEAHCLKAFSGHGAAKALVHEEGMLIIERAIPGETLKGYFPQRDDEAIKIACTIIKNLHRADVPENHDFYHVSELLQRLDNNFDIPRHILAKARKKRDDLIASSDKTVLLHGDLHHDNILQNGDDWMVIDPKGFIGDPTYEIAAFIRNPIPELLAHENALNIIRHRITRFAAILELSEHRIIDWCFVQAVLTWIWALEDNNDTAYFRQLTLLFASMIDSANTDNIPIDVALVRRLISAQFPEWADLQVTPVASSGWDNRTFHLGEHMTVRLPSRAEYAPQVEKEHHWLPKLAPQLPLLIPTPVAMGKPGEGYPWQWSIYRWLDGQTASIARITDLCQFATTLGEFLSALQRCDTTDGPMAGPQNFYRGGALATYEAETRQAIATIENKNDADAITAVWNAALGSTWQGAPVWVHGDIAFGNLLVENDQLVAVIDFGQLGIGDPACDLAITWTLFKGESRNAFRAALPLDSATWARARGWTLWKILCAPLPGTSHAEIKRVINEIIADHQRVE
jgi:aminoglycoside phosphotransferase (APT) family kinase protein